MVQKLSYHGLGDIYFSAETHAVFYFSAETHARLKPATLVVSADSVHCGKTVQERMSALCKVGNSKLHHTYHGDFSLIF